MSFKVSIPTINEKDLIQKTNSQAGQDLFAVAMLNGQRHKTFLEIGTGHFRYHNNTFLLEKEFEWSGISIDINDRNQQSDCWNLFHKKVQTEDWFNADWLQTLPKSLQEHYISLHNIDKYVLFESLEIVRPRTTFYICDALNFDYTTINKYYDYLQIDIEPEWNNYLVLEKIVSNIEFGCITFEHDLWRGSAESLKAKENSHKLLINLGYVLIADDVCAPLHLYPKRQADAEFGIEDWYANPKYIDHKIIQSYQCIGTSKPKSYTDILFDKCKN